MLRRTDKHNYCDHQFDSVAFLLDARSALIQRFFIIRGHSIQRQDFDTRQNWL